MSDAYISPTIFVQYLKENLDALRLHLTPAEVEEVRAVAARADAAQGSRYPPGLAGMLFADTPALKP